MSESYEAARTPPEIGAVSNATQPSAGEPVLFEKRSALDVALANRIARAAWSVEVFRMKGMLTGPNVRHYCPLKG